MDSRKHIFIDVSEGLEVQKKESFTNEVEAEAIMDYYLNLIQKDEELINSCSKVYIVSPFRTQAHLIRTLIQDSKEVLQNKKNCK